MCTHIEVRWKTEYKGKRSFKSHLVICLLMSRPIWIQRYSFFICHLRLFLSCSWRSASVKDLESSKSSHAAGTRSECSSWWHNLKPRISFVGFPLTITNHLANVPFSEHPRPRRHCTLYMRCVVLWCNIAGHHYSIRSGQSRKSYECLCHAVKVRLGLHTKPSRRTDTGYRERGEGSPLRSIPLTGNEEC